MANAITLPRLIEEEKTFEIDFDSGSSCISEYFNNFVSLWRLPLSSYTFDLIINNIFDHFASHNVEQDYTISKVSTLIQRGSGSKK